MENKNTPNKTPSKFLENLPRDVRENFNRRNQIQSSPFCVLPNHTTPPSRLFKIRNPFEAAINEQLHKHIFSPSVFSESNPPKSEKFKWTIDDVSTLKPANIDVSTVAQFEQTCPEEDAKVQAKIEKYFSEIHIVPSPWNQDCTNQPPLIQKFENSRSKLSEKSTEMCNVWTQTVLSLPPQLPEAVENALLPYFTFNEDQRRQTVDLNSSLCRRLFHFESEAESVSSESSNHSEISVIGSPFHLEGNSDKRKRNFDSSPEFSSDIIPGELSPIDNSTPKKLSNCQISPISTNIDLVRIENSMMQDESTPSINLKKNRSFAVADFSGHMSVDTSFNLAPENEAVAVLDESPVRSNLENSCNWDLEYNNILISSRPIRRNLFESKRRSIENMEISNTPKSKILNSQRKKLSDSFKFSNSFKDDELEEEAQYKNRKRNYDSLVQDSQDTGYNTETSQKSTYIKNEDIEMCDDSAVHENRNPNIFASTPSKQYIFKLN